MDEYFKNKLKVLCINCNYYTCIVYLCKLLLLRTVLYTWDDVYEGTNYTGCLKTLYDNNVGLFFLWSRQCRSIIFNLLSFINFCLPLL